MLNCRKYKITELIFLFIALPLLYYFNLIPIHKAVPLLAVFVYCLYFLFRSRKFNRKQLFVNGFKGWKLILAKSLIFFTATLLVVWIIMPNDLFDIPRRDIKIWFIIVITYPLWSVLPQEVIFRSFFVHRYKNIFKKEYLMVISNAALFSFAHIIFNNPVAIIMTFVGSIFFYYTYKQSKSLVAVFLEHTIYGNIIFTVGLGRFFYVSMMG